MDWTYVISWKYLFVADFYEASIKENNKNIWKINFHNYNNI